MTRNFLVGMIINIFILHKIEFMIELFSLIKSLSTDEQKTVKTSLRKFISIETESYVLEKLFIHVLSEKNKIKSDKQLSLLVYQKEKLDALVKLKSRLFYFILEVLSSDNLLRKVELYDPCDKQIIRIRKRMLQFRVVYRKKNRAEFLILSHLLNEIIKEGKAYEQYDIVVEALIFKKYLLMLRKEFSEIKEIVSNIAFYENAHEMMLIANDYYFNLIVDQEIINKLNPQQKQKMLRSAITELKKYLSQINSANIQFINKVLELEYLISLNKHKNTVEACYDIIAHLYKHHHICRDQWIGFVYDNMSQCQVYKHDYKSAITSSKKAQTFYSSKSNSLLASKQQEFYALFYSGQYKLANEMVKNLLNFPIINSGDFRYDKFLFLNACTLFKLGFYNDALNICNKTLELNKDKIRWDIGVRYLRFMCLTELKDFDGSQKSIDAFRKSKDRNIQAIPQRDELIYQMLNEYVRQGFHSTPTLKLENIWKKLSAQNDMNSWNYYTHEIIPIHSWLESKVKFKSAKKV